MPAISCDIQWAQQQTWFECFRQQCVDISAQRHGGT